MKSLNSYCNAIFEKIDFSDSSSSDLHIEELLNTLSEKSILFNIMSEYMAKMKMHIENANLSYRHANGYYKIVLYFNKGKKIKLRLHIWPNNEIITNAKNIHNHRWNYYSQIISGTLVNEIYQVEELDNSRKYFHYKYTSKGDGLTYGVDYIGMDSLILLDSIIQDKRSFYKQDYSVLHRIVPSNTELTATLFVTKEIHDTPFNDLFSPNALTTKGKENFEVDNFELRDLERNLMLLYNNL